MIAEEKLGKFENYVNGHLGFRRFRDPRTEDGVFRGLADGMIIRFTGIISSSDFNAEYELNNDINRRVWFTQLAGKSNYGYGCFFTREFELDYSYCVSLKTVEGRQIILDIPDGVFVPFVAFKDNTHSLIQDFSPDSFYKRVEGKAFRVDQAPPGFNYTFNRITADEKGLYDIDGICAFVRNCINNDCLEDLGNLVRRTTAFGLTEI